MQFVIYKFIFLVGVLAGGYTISARINDFLKVSYCHVHPNYLPTNGAMTGCHLHLTFKENNKAVDPLKYLKKQ